MKKEMTSQYALVRLEELCARAERCTGELREKLYKWGISGADSEKIIESLKSRRFVDDERFTNAYVADKVKFARWGKRKIYQGLKQKRIDTEIVKEALAAVDETLYTENLRNIIGSKIKATPALIESYEGRTKLYRMAVQRGYEPSLAGDIIKELCTRE